MISSSTAGLKEFGDGDVALFNGNLMIEVTPDEDFEADFRKVLMCEEDATFNNYKSLIRLENDQISASSTNERHLNLLQEDSSSNNLSLSMSDFYATPPETEMMKFEAIGVSPIKFEEDPLSEYLNLRESTQIQSSSVIKKKRGRPVSIKFKTSDQQHETEKFSSSLKFKTLKPRSSEVKRLNNNNNNNNNNPNNNNNNDNNNNIIYNSTSKLQLRDRRYDDDHYTPIWIRGRGSEREGLCPLCNPSVWLKIKQSAYWYHMNFFHGICAATGRQYKRPIAYRLALIDGGAKKKFVEGHCGTCLQWIQIASEYDGDGDCSNLVNEICFNSWYKHAQKCHHRIKEFQIPDYF